MRVRFCYSQPNGLNPFAIANRRSGQLPPGAVLVDFERARPSRAAPGPISTELRRSEARSVGRGTVPRAAEGFQRAASRSLPPLPHRSIRPVRFAHRPVPLASSLPPLSITHYTPRALPGGPPSLPLCASFDRSGQSLGSLPPVRPQPQEDVTALPKISGSAEGFS